MYQNHTSLLFFYSGFETIFCVNVMKIEGCSLKKGPGHQIAVREGQGGVKGGQESGVGAGGAYRLILCHTSYCTNIE